MSRIENIIKAVDGKRNMILRAERDLWSMPELGFKEWRSSAYMAERFGELGYEVKTAGDIPGFYTVVDTGKDGPEVLLLCELDGVICPSHEDADPETGAVHACGHNTQCAAMLGVAAALKDEEVLSGLCGRIRLCVVPAEECLDIEYRQGLRDAGVIRYLGGKSEFLSRGYFDGVDLAFMVHMSTGATSSGAYVSLGGRSLGFVTKRVTFKGKTAHASAAPWLGKNALYAATTALSAANALRETFRPADNVKWHPILTDGGTGSNNIPDTAVIEGTLRAVSYEAIERESAKIDRAMIGAALAFGVGVEIEDEPGYAPLYQDRLLGEVALEAYDMLAPLTDLERKRCSFGYDGVGGGSMDMGDLSSIMPVIHPYLSGSSGRGHGDDYRIVDPETACVTNAKWQVATVSLLLEDGAARAKEIIESYEASFSSKEEFLAHQDKMRRKGERIEYLPDGKVNII